MNRETSTFPCDTTDPMDLRNLPPEKADAIPSQAAATLSDKFRLISAPPACGASATLIIPKLLTWPADGVSPIDAHNEGKLTLPDATRQLLARAGIVKTKT